MFYKAEKTGFYRLAIRGCAATQTGKMNWYRIGAHRHHVILFNRLEFPEMGGWKKEWR